MCVDAPETTYRRSDLLDLLGLLLCGAYCEHVVQVVFLVFFWYRGIKVFVFVFRFPVLIDVKVRLDVVKYRVRLRRNVSSWEAQERAKSYMKNQHLGCSMSMAHVGKEKPDVVFSRTQ